MREVIENQLTLDADSVWVRQDAKAFDYSDGIAAEQYLESVLSASSDLGSESEELESRIKDWPSEYHLSRARAQLLKGFDYGPAKSVLEVGCGCGAITRFLGETFERVVSVEGSHARARLARMRTRDLPNVAIVNSPFEELRFTAAFDIVFCIGVFEYSSVFVDADDPHRRILEYFSRLLAPGGALVLAIENQFGLKYFGSSAEDHTGVMFDGIEGYPRRPHGPRTFAHGELQRLLGEQFRSTEFYFPCPDYKRPSCVISQRMLEKVDVGELIGSCRSVDHAKPGRGQLFSEQLAWREISRNGTVPSFANSFLIVAGNEDRSPVSADWLGILYSNRRRKQFSAVTRFVQGERGTVRVIKSRTDGGERHTEGNLEHRGWEGDWIDSVSLHTSMVRRARQQDLTLAEIFGPSKVWYDDLKASSVEQDGDRWVEGSRLDSIWRNCYVVDGRCRYIDQEWAWTHRLPLKLVVSRGLYYFARELLGYSGLNPGLRGMRVWKLMRAGARQYGLELSRRDLPDLARLEASFLRETSTRRPRTARERLLTALGVGMVLKRRLDPAAPGGTVRFLKRWLRTSVRAVLPRR